MDEIRLIRDRRELRGTLYMELLPGRYQNKCWNDESVYVAERVFGYLESVISRHVPKFYHWGVTDISHDSWNVILTDLDRLAHDLETATGLDGVRDKIRFLFEDTEARFAASFPASTEALAKFLRELIPWVRHQLQRHDFVSILGI